LFVSFTKDKEYHEGMIETDNVGVAHLDDLQLCLDHAGTYQVHAHFVASSNFDHGEANTIFNSYP
jgi:hypothetical protein